MGATQGQGRCCCPDSDDAQKVELLPQSALQADAVDLDIGDSGECDGDVERLFGQNLASEAVGEGVWTEALAGAEGEEEYDDGIPTMSGTKSVLKKRAGNAVSVASSSSTRRTASFSERFSVRSVPRKSQTGEKEKAIIFGDFEIKRSGSYAALGLGYLVDAELFERELQSRQKVKSIFEDDDTVRTSSSSSGRLLKRSFEGLYTCTTEIDSGSFGTLFRAVPKKHGGKVVAAKCVTRDSLEAFRVTDLYRVETSAAFGCLKHRNVAWRKAFFIEVDCLYIVSEILTGSSLFDVMCDIPNLPTLRAARYAYQMLSALNYIHQCGIVHRDVKPENFLLENMSPTAQLKLIDFGLARVCSEDHCLSTIVGTLAYTAPEVLHGLYNHSADVWSCGCTLFLCIVGIQSILADDDETRVECIITGRIPWQMTTFVNETLQSLLKAMLVVEPNERSSARSLLQWEMFCSREVHQSFGCGLF